VIFLSKKKDNILGVMKLSDEKVTQGTKNEDILTNEATEIKGSDTEGQVLEDNGKADGNNAADEIIQLKGQLAKKEEELKDYIELTQRVKAEFDNYRKRTAREKEQLYTDITGDIILKLLPVVDNMERAVSSSADTSDYKKLVDGMEMILRQFKDILTKEGLEEVESKGAKFDPNTHSAVMHIEDEAFDENTIVEVFQKGYKIKDKVIRPSMVKVAN
jgi:molecular chaperone GrpE